MSALPLPASSALACHGITVKYGTLTALADVSISFAPGRIHAVVGQNGAGKTTFARVCAGIVTPSDGRLSIGGKPIRPGSVSDARRGGVELVHQSFALPPSFSVAEALEFGSRRRAAPVYSRRALAARWRAHLESVDVRARLSDRIADLPVETQQGVEIARALVTDARVLILDEPTAVLAPAGIAQLFARLQRLRDNGVTVVVILHKVREVLAIAETIAVLRGGRLVADGLAAATLTPARLGSAIVGAAAEPTAVAAAQPIAVAAAVVAPPLLVIEAAATRATPEGPALDAVSLRIARGEIVGIAGVEGNGQRTLVSALAGLISLHGGRISLAGADITRLPLRERRRHGLRIIPFERATQGLSVSGPLWQNYAARSLAAVPLLQPIEPRRLREAARRAFERWDVRFAGVDVPAGSLSGGNAQKIILAREIDPEAQLIVAAQPTRGLDIGAAAFVWQALRDARDRGCSVILISSDLDELCDISDRIVVMLSGRIAAGFAPPYAANDIGAVMSGAHA